MSNPLDSKAERLKTVDAYLREMEKIESVDAVGEDPERADSLVLISAQETFVAWWSLSSGGLARARANLASDAQVELVLRLYLEGKSTRTIDVEVGVWFGQQRIAVDRGVRQVSAAIGYRDGQSFSHIVRAVPILRPGVSQGNGSTRSTTLDWSNAGCVTETNTFDIARVGGDLNRYVYAASAENVYVGLLGGDL